MYLVVLVRCWCVFLSALDSFRNNHVCAESSKSKNSQHPARCLLLVQAVSRCIFVAPGLFASSRRPPGRLDACILERVYELERSGIAFMKGPFSHDIRLQGIACSLRTVVVRRCVLSTETPCCFLAIHVCAGCAETGRDVELCPSLGPSMSVSLVGPRV